MFPPECCLRLAHWREYALITHDSALPKPMVRGDRAASKRNGMLAVVSKGELHMSAVGRSGTLLF
jgi:hypothetical protein